MQHKTHSVRSHIYTYLQIATPWTRLNWNWKLFREGEREREDKTLAHTMRYIWNEISEIFL